MPTTRPPLDWRDLACFEAACYLSALLVILLTFADRHGFWPTLALQLSAMLAIVALTRGLPWWLAHRARS
jgi:hypothetical protein